MKEKHRHRYLSCVQIKDTNVYDDEMDTIFTSSMTRSRLPYYLAWCDERDEREREEEMRESAMLSMHTMRDCSIERSGHPSLTCAAKQKAQAHYPASQSAYVLLVSYDERETQR